MGARPSSPRTRAAARWVGLGLALFLLQAIWALSIPLMASPDEPSHVVRAAAVAEGQWSGTLGAPPTDASIPGTPTTVTLPADYAAAVALPNCFAFRSNQPASCQQSIPPSGGATAPVQTFAGQYPPLYYALVGWPSRFLSAEHAIYGMRLVSAAVTAALLAWAAWRLRASVLPAAATWAILVALTPMTLFVGATVNPQALEISSAAAFWAAILALVVAPGRPSRATFVQAAVAGAVLVNSRSSGPVWALAAVVVALVLAPRARLRLLWAMRAMRWTLVAAVGAGALAVGWLVTHGGVVTGNHLFPQYAGPLTVARTVLANTHQYLQQMVGDFGWLDAPSPAVTTTAWAVAVGSLLLVAIAFAGWSRPGIALTLAAIVVVAGPVALQIPTAVNTGIVWQGRYTLPFAVGVPMVAAVALGSRPSGLEELLRRVARWIVPVVAVAHVAAFWWAARRYAVGLSGHLLTRSPQWSSPVGYLSAVALYAVVVSAAALGVWWSLRRPAPRDPVGFPPVPTTTEAIA